jgi:hypothetical protein
MYNMTLPSVRCYLKKATRVHLLFFFLVFESSLSVVKSSDTESRDFLFMNEGPCYSIASACAFQVGIRSMFVGFNKIIYRFLLDWQAHEMAAISRQMRDELRLNSSINDFNRYVWQHKCIHAWYVLALRPTAAVLWPDASSYYQNISLRLLCVSV